VVGLILAMHRRVGNGATLGFDAWAKSLGAVAHASTPEHAILPTLRLTARR
jgi:hypothetical protein